LLVLPELVFDELLLFELLLLVDVPFWLRIAPLVLVLEAVAVLSVTSAPRSFCPGRRSALGEGGANVGGGRVQMGVSVLCDTPSTYARNPKGRKPGSF